MKYVIKGMYRIGMCLGIILNLFLIIGSYPYLTELMRAWLQGQGSYSISEMIFVNAIIITVFAYLMGMIITFFKLLKESFSKWTNTTQDQRR